MHWGFGVGGQRTALGAVVFIAEVFAQERDVDDSALWQVVVIGGCCKGDGVFVGASACWLFGTTLDMARERTGKEGFAKLSTSSLGRPIWISATPAVKRIIGSWRGVVWPTVEGEGDVADGLA